MAARLRIARDVAQWLGSGTRADEFLTERFRAALSASARLRRGETAPQWLRRVISATRDSNIQSADASALSDAKLAAWVLAVLPSMRPRYSDLLRRLDVFGEPKAKVARELKQSANTTDVALHRARQLLRRRLLVLCIATSAEKCVAALRARQTLR